MIRKFTFNKKRLQAIVLIHGLHTTSGFWLSYFKLFKDYRIIAFDLNYESILESEIQFEKVKEFFNKWPVNENIVGVVSHSLGTLISDLVYQDKNYPVFKICPIGYSNRFDTEGFVLNVVERSNLATETVRHSIELVDRFRSRVEGISNLHGCIYVPDNDAYFNYYVPVDKRIVFKGDHFDISKAIEDIVFTKLKSTQAI